MKFKKYILAILLLLLSGFTVYAYSNVSEGFDTSLVRGIEYTYQEPKKVLFTQIEGNYDKLSLSIENYLDTIYYYGITKLKLGNIPFHYAVDESGNVYKTQEQDSVKVTDEAYIVVAYLSNNGQLSNKAGSGILELMDDLSYRYGIQEYDIYKYSLSQSEDKISKLTLTEPNELFVNSLAIVFEGWEGSTREHLEYIATVESVEYEETVEIGERLGVKVVIRNENDFIWTSNKDPIYLSSKDSEESPFAVNQVWDSFSKVTTVDSGITVLPGESIELEFELEPKVLPGEYSQSFELLKFEGEPFKGSDFTTDFTVEKGDGRVVRIDSPELGFVNIRECRRFSCEKVHIVNHNEVYPVVEYHESCWYKIRYGDNKEGWFYCPYADEI